MQRLKDKYGRGSAAANGAEFVDLEPGDTFSGLEAKLRLVQTVIYENRMLGLRASIASRRNANELSKHMVPGEAEEAHKFAAKNVGALFARGAVGIRHFDKKAMPGARWIVTYVRVFSWFIFAGKRKLATITLKENKGLNNFYSVEAVEINEDADSERTPRGAMSEDLNSAPFQNLASQLANRIAYYVGDVNRTQPSFVASEEQFSVELAASEILKMNGGQTVAKADISVIILIGQEKIHLKRCVEKLAALKPRQIFLVESQPDDGGVAIAKETAAKLGLRLESRFNKWPGLYAAQYQWALDNLPIEAEWVLRSDADEYLTEETCERIVRMFDCSECSECSIDEDVAGFTLELKRIIFGGEIRHATNGIRLLRIFRRGRARIEQRAMDEHMLVDGKVIDFDGAFYDHNLNSFEWWQEKHRGYAKREAQDAVALFDCSDCSIERLKNPSPTDRKKIAYYKLPRYLRAVMYFCIRYFLKGGFLDGRAGWRWNFWQGLWYRWIVDREIGRIRCRG